VAALGPGYGRAEMGSMSAREEDRRLAELFGHSAANDHNQVTKALYRLGSKANLPPWADVLRADPCSYCGVRGKMTLDHVDPRSRTKESRGKPNVANAAAACYSCNQRKGPTGLLRFLITGGLGAKPLARAPMGPMAATWALRRFGPSSTARVAEAIGVTAEEAGHVLGRLLVRGKVHRVDKMWRLPK
jgi:hypothetical protein